jgi:urea transport system permease protein
MGPIVGAVLVNYLKTFFTGALPEAWLYALGALFVLVTLFLPRGLMGLLTLGVEARDSVGRVPTAAPTPQVGAASATERK